jgi:hypothetical protein
MCIRMDDLKAGHLRVENWLLVPEYKCEVCSDRTSTRFYRGSPTIVKFLLRRRPDPLLVTFHSVVHGSGLDPSFTESWKACFARSSIPAPPNSMFNSDVLQVKHEVALMVGHYAVGVNTPSLAMTPDGSSVRSIKALISTTNSQTIVLVCCYTSEYIKMLQSCAEEHKKHVIFFNGCAISWSMCCNLVFGAVMLHATCPISIDEAFRVMCIFVYFVYFVCVYIYVSFTNIIMFFVLGATTTYCCLRHRGSQETPDLSHTPDRCDDYCDPFTSCR